MLKTVMLVIANVIFLVTGQVLWKIGLRQLGPLNLTDMWKIICSGWFLGGLFTFLGATAVWLLALSRSELSVVYPLQSVAYIIGMVAGLLFLQEDIPFTAWVGGALILVGAYLVGRR
ncbi:MAG: EamA family transporter [Moorellaceae bacterium]